MRRDQVVLELLEEAVDRGRGDRAIVEEADVERLRGDPRFTAIVRQVEGRRGPA